MKTDLCSTLVIGLDPSLTGFGLSDGTEHVVIATSNSETLRSRCATIYAGIYAFAAPRIQPQLWVVEAPMLNPKLGMHLYEVGWIMSHVYDAFDTVSYVPENQIIEVSPATLKRFVTGKGNVDKTAMALRAYKRWGIEIAGDKGGNLVDAYCLHRYGLAVVAGEIEHVVAAKRGQKRKIA